MGRIPSKSGNTRLSDCIQGESKMSAVGRKLPLITSIFKQIERPLSGKADIQILVSEKSLRNDRYAPESRHWTARLSTVG